MNEFEHRAHAAFEAGDMTGVFDAVNQAMKAEGSASASLLGLLGRAFDASGMPAEAAEAFEAAADLAPSDPFPHLKAAMLAHDRSGAGDRAFLLAMRAQRSKPDDPDVVYVIARELSARGETELLTHFRNRLTASDDIRHLELARQLIGAENRNPFNLVLFKKLARMSPNDPFTRFKPMSIAREFCDYDTIEAEERWMRAELVTGNESIFEGETPYANLLHCGDARLNRLATNNRDIRSAPPPEVTARRRGLPHVFSDKIRIGYLSSDFAGTHATMRLLRRVLELHDRNRFEITLYDYTPPALIAGADDDRTTWGRIVPIHDLDDEAAAARIRADAMDILVDLKGHTGGSRARILNFAAAPVQVAWLGFPGSTVNVDLDYVIADHLVLPDVDLVNFHEHACRLPVCYQPNDPYHRPLPAAAKRENWGLPADRFVFASFNAQRKITPHCIDLWAQILMRAQDSVLWVMIDGEQARRNFLARMLASGVDTQRIVFTAMAEYPAHIARLQTADLGLDTFPYNGHTTTSDMLWAGLPVLTVRGSSFASRVSESLLNAVGLADQVAEDRAAYVKMAVAMAADPSPLTARRQHLAEKRRSMPLFDASAFCGHLERAFEIMHDRARNRLQPTIINL